MFLRIVLVLGVGLILLAGGAAGWQYYHQQLEAVLTAEAPAAAAPQPAGKAEEAPAPSQNWLISPGGGLVDKEAAQVFLAQDRFSRSRKITVSFRADLADLLAKGETLPAPVYQRAFAEVRALRHAQGLCAPILETLAGDCAPTEVSLIDDSYDPAGASVGFTAVLVFRLKPESGPLPDLASHVLETATIGGEIQQVSGKSPFLSTLGDTLKLAQQTCRVEAVEGRFCRVSAIRIDAFDRPQTSFAIVYDTLGPMPDGMYPAAPL